MTAAAAVAWAIGGLYVVWPLLADLPSRVSSDKSSDSPDTSGSVLDQIADLDLEFAAGKIPEETYQKVRRDLMREVVVAGERERIGEVTGARSSTEAKFCASCGKAVGAKDRFCSSCGKEAVS